MSTAEQFIQDIMAMVPDPEMPIRVNVVGDDTDLHITDIVVNPSDGVVRIIVEDLGEEAVVPEAPTQPDPPVAPNQ